MRNPRGAVVVLLVAGALAGCAEGLPVDRLPPGAARTGASGPSDGGVSVPRDEALRAEGDTWIEIVPEPVPEPEPAPRGLLVDPPADPLEAFRRLEDACARYSSLVGRGDPDRTPRVDPDRFVGAAVVREIASGAALIEDGRGTRLVLDGWHQQQPVLLPESGRPDLPPPEPYRLACP